MIKDLEIVKFDFCFYTIENYNVYIFQDGRIPECDIDNWLESYNEFDTFWININ
jgi:hypothetical protein